VLVVAGLALVGAGCGTTESGAEEGYASVVIRNHTDEEVVAAVARVFHAEGYRSSLTGPGQVLFVKDASFLTAVSRDGLIAASGGGRPVRRALVEILKLDDGAHRVRCSATLMTGGNDPFFQEEKRQPKAPYQSLLNKAAKELK
jgi:hypothetical protein